MLPFPTQFQHQVTGSSLFTTSSSGQNVLMEGWSMGPHATPVRKNHTYTSHGNYCLTLDDVKSFWKILCNYLQAFIYNLHKPIYGIRRYRFSSSSLKPYMHTPCVRCWNNIDPFHIQMRNIMSQPCMTSCLEHYQSLLSPPQDDWGFAPSVSLCFWLNPCKCFLSFLFFFSCWI